MALWQWNPTSFQGKDLSEKVSPESTASLTEKVTTAPIIVQSVTFIKKGLKKSKAPAEVIEIAPGKIVEPEKNVTATWPPASAALRTLSAVMALSARLAAGAAVSTL